MTKIVFLGTPRFSAEVLRDLLQRPLDIVAVVTQPDRPKGRSGSPQPSPVKVVAQKNNVPVYTPEKASAPEFASILESYNADLFVVAAYGEIIKENLLNMPKIDCINVHTSLLPKYRGAAPIQRCIMEGEKETGVTIMHMVKKLDAGDIIEVARSPISEDMTYGELEDALCELSKPTLYRAIQNLVEGKAQRIPQNHDARTYAKKILTDDCELLWEKPAVELHNLVRGVTPKPGAWVRVLIRGQEKRLKVKETSYYKNINGIPGGLVSYKGDAIIVACGEGAIGLKELQLEGKKAMQAEEFVRGIKKEDLSFKELPCKES